MMDLLPAGVTPIGKASPACAPSGWMQVNSQPAKGSTRFTLLCENAPKAAPGFLVVGLPSARTPILGIDLFVGPVVMVPVRSDARGFGSLNVPLPQSLVLPAGVATQFVWVANQACGGTVFRATNALRL